MNRIKPNTQNPTKVDNSELPAMKKGDKVQIKDRYYPGTEYTNPVRWIDGIIDSKPFEFDGKISYMVKVYGDVRWHELAKNIKRDQ